MCPLNNTITKNYQIGVLTRGKLIVFGHLQEKACTPLKKSGPASLQLNPPVVHPSPTAHQYYKGATC
jgi:hypothetical protein